MKDYLSFTQMKISELAVTIECNFDKDMCGFTIHSNGDDASKSGFVWKKGTANWIINNELEGPDIGIISLPSS